MFNKTIIMLVSSFSLLFPTTNTPVESLPITTKHTAMRDAQQQLQLLGRYHWPTSEQMNVYMRHSLKQLQRDYRLRVNGELTDETQRLLQQLTALAPYEAKGVALTTKVESKPKSTPKPKVEKVKKRVAVKQTKKEKNKSPAPNEVVDLLAKAVHSEARGEPFQGKVAVAAVILNRTEAKGFPRTVRGVIYQPKAFTAVSNGQFSLKPSKSAYQAAREALRGVDPTGGATYYFNPETATSGWMFEEAKKHRTTKIGKHVFLKSRKGDFGTYHDMYHPLKNEGVFSFIC
jgi:N-acetylmuramoyl-L-alanine amidase